jgi:hypothetical protein
MPYALGEFDDKAMLVQAPAYVETSSIANMSHDPEH